MRLYRIVRGACAAFGALTFVAACVGAWELRREIAR